MKAAIKEENTPDYTLRLEEKQKWKMHYCLKEHQLRRFIRNAKKGGGSSWLGKLANLLESRLDNIVFRLGLAPSIPSARQLIRHGHILVEGKKKDIPSIVLEPGQQVAVKEKSKNHQMVLMAKKSPRLEAPNYLNKDEQGGTGKITTPPGIDHIPFKCDPGLFTEYYAARKA